MFFIYLDTDKKEACVRVGEHHDLQSKDCIVLEAYDEKRGLLFYQGVINRVDSDTILIKKLCLVDEKQRRTDVRINVSIPLTLKIISKGVEFIRPNKKLLLETVNVSAGGMLLKSDKDLGDCGTHLTYDFPLEEKVLNCEAQIVRKQIDGACFLYGCKLLNNENDRADLRKLVFQIQVKTKKANFERGE